VHPEKDRGERAPMFANSIFLPWERVVRAACELSEICFAGLGNRLHVLVSALALAEAAGRQFKFYCPRTPALAGRLAEALLAGAVAAGARPPRSVCAKIRPRLSRP